MPASRRARAITLAPRSWPSRPGLAINTRIFLSGMVDLRILSVSSVDFCGPSGELFRLLPNIAPNAILSHANVEIEEQTWSVLRGKVVSSRSMRYPRSGLSPCRARGWISAVPRLDFCILRCQFCPFHKGLQDFSRRRIQSGVFKYPFLPSRKSQSSENILERCGV